MKYLNELEYEYFHEEFEDLTFYNEYIKPCPTCENIFKEYSCCQQNYIQYYPHVFYCDNCDKYSHNCQIWKNNKTFIRCKKCYKNLKSRTNNKLL